MISSFQGFASRVFCFLFEGTVENGQIRQSITKPFVKIVAASV